MQIRLTTIQAACAAAFLCLFSGSMYAQQSAPAAQAAPPIPEAQLVQPAELASMLSASTGEKPLILQVGSRVLYAEAHIPGSEYAGAGGQEAGLQTLRDRVRDLKHDEFIVIYCGCCPWVKCPNIRAAYQQLVSLGFTHVKALYIADNFGTNWVARGYPVAKGR